MAYSSTIYFMTKLCSQRWKPQSKAMSCDTLSASMVVDFSFWKRIKHDEFSSTDDEYDDEDNTSNHCEPGTLGTSIHNTFKPILSISMASLAIRVIVSLLD